MSNESRIQKALDELVVVTCGFYRCFLAHPTNPRGHEGCHLAANHYGSCAHRPIPSMLCIHRGGWYPCVWHPLEEIGSPGSCPARYHDPGDEDRS